ncbi:rhomboid family intramembrane serine protease [Millisia brevis]|uniref:rhomboid family intramembrane serine protease n=1 Tax=Millisia brevis TaxID=264148 RepID=UPI00082ED288|nr:rhomboid family intramembrane serine protease [Millisia brevis]
MTQPPGPVPYQQLPGCYRHPDRATGLSCVRCGRPACPECLRSAPVGNQCLDCIRADPADVRTPQRPGPTRASAAPITMGLIAINVAIFAITAVQSRSLFDNASGSTLFDRLVLFGPLVGYGDLERLIGSGFLHYGPLHLLANMLALFIFGRDCEVFFGRARYLAIYFLSLLGGSASVLVMQPMGATAGASGAVFGLFGATLLVVLRLRRNPSSLIMLLVLNFGLSVAVPGISLWGHLGGLLAGAAVAAGFLYLRKQAYGWAVVGGIAALIVTIIAVRAIQLREVLAPILQ